MYVFLYNKSINRYMNKSFIKNFQLIESSKKILIEKLKSKLFSILTKNSMNIFIRGGDILSVYPQISGRYEYSIIELINYLSKKNNDFFIDIGANIGLTSVQCGKKFKKIILFEPNIFCLPILKINLEMNLKKNYEIHQYALGKKNEKKKLYIPMKNWGGAFIKIGNYYKNFTLFQKDGFKKFNTKNYSKQTIIIKNTKIIFSEIFKKLIKEKKLKGIIKIDVEGYEKIIIQEISKILPKNLKLFIIFENLKENIDTKILEKFFKEKVNFYKLVDNYPWSEKDSNIKKFFKLILQNNIESKIKNAEEKIWSGTAVIEIS
jgi:FkbM family methyltransferase